MERGLWEKRSEEDKVEVRWKISVGSYFTALSLMF